MIDHGDPELTVEEQAALGGVKRTGLYYRPATPSLEEVALTHQIDAIDTATPFYGARRITAVLRRAGHMVNRKAVQRPLQEMGSAGSAPGPLTSRPHPTHPIYPYLLRHITADRPHHIWGIDSTYIRLERAWMYLVVVLDWYTRYVISWELDQSVEQGCVRAALDRALQRATPALMNSDQGSHFTRPGYRDRLTTAQVQISMAGKGRALDNIFTERLWRTVTYEEVYLHSYASPREARHSITRYLQCYTTERPQQALGYQTPAERYDRAWI